MISARLRVSCIRALLLGALLTLAACSRGSTSIDEDLTAAAGQSEGNGGASTCGNGKIEEGEECDGDALGSGSCKTFGFNGGGTLSCDPDTCRYNTEMCRLGSDGNSSNGGNGG